MEMTMKMKVEMVWIIDNHDLDADDDRVANQSYAETGNYWWQWFKWKLWWWLKPLQAEARAEFAEKSVMKLQHEVKYLSQIFDIKVKAVK